MAKFVVAIFLIALLSTGLSSDEPPTRKCPRASPEEMWYSDYSPWLKTTAFEEMAYYFRLIFSRLEGDALFTFLPHFKEDPEKAANLTQKMIMTEKKALILMGRAYEVMENSWLSAGETGRLFTAGGVLAKEAIRAMEALQKAHERGNEILLDASREVALFFREMFEHVIEGVTLILETELEEAPEGDHAMAKLIQEKLIKMAPGDLLGIVVRRFIGRSLGTVHTSANKEPPIVLFHALPRINQMHDEFKASIQSEPLTPESWASFWENMYQKSLAATNKRLAEGLENFVLIYRNEIYMYEVLMNMITSYT